MPARLRGPLNASAFCNTPGPTGYNDAGEPFFSRSTTTGSAPMSDSPSASLLAGPDDAGVTNPYTLYVKTPLGYVASGMSSGKRSVQGLGGQQIWVETGAVLFRVGEIAIDLDGAPDTYHPPVYPQHWNGSGPNLGRDTLLNAASNWRELIAGCQHDGAPAHAGPHRWCVKTNPADWQHAHWVGIQTDANGQPLIRQNGPYRGFYVPRVMPPWADASEHPWVVLNRNLRTKLNIQLGNPVVVILNTQVRTVAYGMLADPGPKGNLGEISNALLGDLGLTGSNTNGDFIFVTFPGTEDLRQRTAQQIRDSATKAFVAWGGLEMVKQFFPTTNEYIDMCRDYDRQLMKYPGYRASHRPPTG